MQHVSIMSITKVDQLPQANPITITFNTTNMAIRQGSKQQNQQVFDAVKGILTEYMVEQMTQEVNLINDGLSLRVNYSDMHRLLV